MSGGERSGDVIRPNRGRSAEEMMNAVLGAVGGSSAGRPQSDDSTIMVIRAFGA
jgi:hypothetical protein